ncbi:hypothetical protein PMIN01_04587 [Paraphaeosphaeria minitans]|uniref:Uncharacterized protein n=1 Tax=Paraphaeosphaeria minitans TaxID=565426 RepID=A0A9P6KRG2_9PLEO|nr:hypothetical protein PMIN01_04587 [Paraphaeosphaeria minitans]
MDSQRTYFSLAGSKGTESPGGGAVRGVTFASSQQGRIDGDGGRRPAPIHLHILFSRLRLEEEGGGEVVRWWCVRAGDSTGRGAMRDVSRNTGGWGYGGGGGFELHLVPVPVPLG